MTTGLIGKIKLLQSSYETHNKEAKKLDFPNYTNKDFWKVFGKD